MHLKAQMLKFQVCIVARDSVKSLNGTESWLTDSKRLLEKEHCTARSNEITDSTKANQ